MQKLVNGCQAYTPTPAERWRKWLGFGYRLGEEPPGNENLTGWWRTGVQLRLDWLDRLRLLLRGEVRLHLTNYADGQPENVVTRVDYEIIAPFTKTPRS